MAGRVDVYDLTQVLCSFGPVQLRGFADGDVVSLEYDEERETAVAGGDGDVVRVRRASRLATATVRLQRGSPAALQLRQLLQSLLPPLDQFPFKIDDIAGLTTYLSPNSWCTGSPAPTFSQDAPVEEWTFKLPKLESFTLVLATT